ncbi:hypothetical protein FRB95_011392 [Tulasnella sp. JGI-2019a]|nr:hypothetical protein FRB95_011392 [Tulasnella sp. JGI-2019a]
MATNVKLKSALDDLKKAVAHDIKLTRLVGSLLRWLAPLMKWTASASYKVAPSPSFSSELTKLFNTAILPLYKIAPESALHVSALTTDAIYYKRIVPHLGSNSVDASRKGHQHAWEDILEQGVLEGIVLYMSHPESDRRAVGEHFFALLCPLLYEKSSEKLGVMIRRQVASLLSDATRGHLENLNRLEGSEILGVPRIGEALARTNDFLLLESLAELTSRFTPRASRGGKQFAEKLFKGSASLKAFGTQAVTYLIESFKKQPENRVEFPSFLLRALGLVDINKPQYFSTAEIYVMGRTISLPEGQRYIYIDHNTIFATLDSEEEPGSLDAMEVLLLTVDGIQLSSPVTGTSQVQLTLSVSQPPMVASIPMDGPFGPQAPCTVKMSLDRSDLLRLRNVFDSRQLTGKLSEDTASCRNGSVAVSTVALSLERALPGGPKPSPSFEAKSREIADLLAGGSTSTSSDPAFDPPICINIEASGQPTGDPGPAQMSFSHVSLDNGSDLSDAPEVEESQSRSHPTQVSSRRNRAPSPELSPSPPPRPQASTKTTKADRGKPTTTTAPSKAAPMRKRVREEGSDMEEGQVDPTPPLKRQTIRTTMRGRHGGVLKELPVSNSALSQGLVEPNQQAAGKKISFGSQRKANRGENKIPASFAQSDSEWEEPPVPPVRQSKKTLSSKHCGIPSVNSLLIPPESSKGLSARSDRCLRSGGKKAVAMENTEYAPKVVALDPETPRRSTTTTMRTKRSKVVPPWLQQPPEPSFLAVSVIKKGKPMDPTTPKTSGTAGPSNTMTPLSIATHPRGKPKAQAPENCAWSSVDDDYDIIGYRNPLVSSDASSSGNPSVVEVEPLAEPAIMLVSEQTSTSNINESGMAESGEVTLVDVTKQAILKDDILQSKLKNRTCSRSVTFASQVSIHTPSENRAACVEEDRAPAPKDAQGSPRRTNIDIKSGLLNVAGAVQFFPMRRSSPKDRHSSRLDHYWHPTSPRAGRGSEASAEVAPSCNEVALVKVLDSIRDAVVQNLNNKFEGVRREVQVSRDGLFNDAREDLGKIHNENIMRQGELHHLEEEIDYHRRAVQGRFLKVMKDSENVDQKIRTVIREHDARVLQLSKTRHVGLLFGEKDKPFLEGAAF